jgi:DNA-binding transcriptional ArsR family regulator
MSIEPALKALAEPRRLELLRLLDSAGEMSVGDLAERVAVTQQAVSLHLKVLGEAGLVTARREGVRHLYAVRPEGFRPVADFVAGFWGGHLQAMKDAAENE